MGSTGIEGLLRDRLLITVNDRSAIGLLPHTDGNTGGLLLTGADAAARCRNIRNSYPDTVVAVDYGGHEHRVATADRPFGYQAADGWHALDHSGLEEVLNGQLANKAAFAVTPTCFIPPPDEDGDARVLRAVITQANRLERTDTVVLLPCSYRWLRDESLLHLVAAVRASRHPVALIMQHYKDPLERVGVAEGLRVLCRSCPRLLLWRTDLAAFDALAHGALGTAVGVTAMLRHGMDPRRKGRGWRPYPVVLVRELLKYHRVEVLQNWFARVEPWTCGCAVCEGAELSRFSESTADVRESQWHNTCELYALHDELISADAGPDRLEWWRQIVDDAVARHHLLTSDLGEEVAHPPVLHYWQRPSPPAVPMP
jgi:hypothetical protein